MFTSSGYEDYKSSDKLNFASLEFEYICLHVVNFAPLEQVLLCICMHECSAFVYELFIRKLGTTIIINVQRTRINSSWED